MAISAIVGVNWGDEGKGRMVDYLSNRYDVVVRYQGGNNAGHTVVNQYGKFALNLLPSGIFNPGTVNLLGTGVVIDLEHLCGEIQRLRDAGIAISPDNFKISDRAMICMPFHRWQDQWEEKRLGDAKFGSTQRGIGPVYGDKAMKKSLQTGFLRYPATLEEYLEREVDWKNALIRSAYDCEPIDLDAMRQWLKTYGDPLLPYLCDAGTLLRDAQKAGKSILFEAQLGALRDLDYGIYPYTSSSSPLAAYAPMGSGCPDIKVENVIGVVKAYSSCVGEGPFVGELNDENGKRIRDAGAEYGAATGRPRRVAFLDLVASRYGVMLQGTTSIALTKLDVLSIFEEIPVCRAYRIGGTETEAFPYTPELDGAEPVFDILPGWHCDISNVRRFEDLPKAAQDYVLYVEKALGCPIAYVSVGPAREELILR
jgi:adenylosuccinate synthase